MTPDEIKALRKSLGLATAGLAEKLGVSPRTVENWEQGRRHPSGAALVLLRSLAAPTVAE